LLLKIICGFGCGNGSASLNNVLNVGMFHQLDVVVEFFMTEHHVVSDDEL